MKSQGTAMSRDPSPFGIVAGSGIDLAALLDEESARVPFSEIPGLIPSGVPGHSGQYLHGRCGGIPIVVQSGRLHFYEGQDYGGVTRTVDVMAGFGVKAIVFTNAAGGLRPEMSAGDLLAVDSIRPFVPYRGWPEQAELPSPDFTIPGCDHTGTYVWVHGPSYETRAEIAALQHLQGSAVGMSTAPEASRCRELGIQTGAISCITNNCCQPQHLTHEHVVETARRASERIVDLVRGFLPVLAR